MIKKLLSILVVLPVLCYAQTGIALVNVDEVLNAMPEKIQAEAALQELSSKYQDEHTLLKEEFNRKYADFQAIASDPATPATIKERRMQEIRQNDIQIKAFERDVQADLDSKRAELFVPIQAKLNSAIQATGDEAGVTYIIDSSKQPIIYCGTDAIDLTDKVKSHLGIK